MHFLLINLDNSLAKIISISSVPTSRQEMSEYTNVTNGTNQQELALYKTIVKLKIKPFSYNGKTLSLSQMDLKAQVVIP